MDNKCFMWSVKSYERFPFKGENFLRIIYKCEFPLIYSDLFRIHFYFDFITNTGAVCLQELEQTIFSIEVDNPTIDFSPIHEYLLTKYPIHDAKKYIARIESEISGLEDFSYTFPDDKDAKKYIRKLKSHLQTYKLHTLGAL